MLVSLRLTILLLTKAPSKMVYTGINFKEAVFMTEYTREGNSKRSYGRVLAVIMPGKKALLLG